MEENQENFTPEIEAPAPAPEPVAEKAEPVVEQAAPVVAKAPVESGPVEGTLAAQLAKMGARPPREPREPKEQQPPREGQVAREARPPREPRADNRGENRGPRPEKGAGRPGGERGDRGPRPGGGERREGGRPGGGDRGPRSFEPMMDIDIEKLISDSLYLDNQAHAVVARMRDMDSGTKSQLRRLFNAVRRAVRAPESDRQHQFVMLRARLAYTIARHSLRSLDGLERLLLAVTRKNNAQGYERFKDLFEAIVAYNE